MPQAKRALSAEECAFFREPLYQQQRAAYRPVKCSMAAEGCWVREGPPGVTTDGFCRACHGWVPGKYRPPVEGRDDRRIPVA